MEWTRVNTKDYKNGTQLECMATMLWHLLVVDGVPINGLMRVNSKDCLFLTVKGSSYAASHFMVYELSENSGKLIADEHEKFRLGCGGYNDYGELFTNKPLANKTMFKREYTLGDFDVKYMGHVDYSQILNPYQQSQV